MNLYPLDRGYLSLGATVSEMKKAGKDVIALVGSDPVMDGHTNKPLSKYLIDAARKGLCMYSGNTLWINRLRMAIADFEKKNMNVEYSPDDIFVAPGVAGCWNIVHYTLLDPGDEILTIEPTHYITAPSRYYSVFRAKCVISSSDEENDWEPDLDGLRANVTNKTKGIVIVHPNNPTGAVWDEKTLKAIVDIAGEYGFPVISDEIYGLITFDGVKAKSIASVAGDVPTIVLSGMSKFFMAPGWRVGYVAFHDPEGKMEEVQKTATEVWKLYGHTMKSMPTPILYAATQAFQGPLDASWEFVRTVQANRDFCFKCFNEIKGVSSTKPKGSLYIFPRVDAIGKTWKTDMDFVLEFLKEENVAFTPGYIYGKSGVGHFRCLLAPHVEVLEDVRNRLERFMLRHT
jgi:aspartate/methionine/tyrosine aminotransferase